MELPTPLRQAVDRALEAIPLSSLRQAAKTLSDRYRAELRDGRLHMADELSVQAYLAARLPATYAAARASLEAVHEAAPGFSPRTLLDIGSGPGTMLWAVADLWPDLIRASLVEASAPARKLGARLAEEGGLVTDTQWIAGDATIDLGEVDKADLVSAAYMLDEIAPQSRPKLVERLWALTTDTLLVVEPGTPAGWQRILEVRAQLFETGAHVLGPCPHEAPCPLAAPDWCHFSRRVARSRLHRLAKEADVPWEDEKFVFVAATRRTVSPLAPRVLAPPKSGSGKVALKLCLPDGTSETRLFTKRDGEAFRKARRVDWGDALDG